MEIEFKRNMNKWDRGARSVVGFALLVLGPITESITTDTFSGAIMGILGIVALISAFFSYCILYEITGFNTSGTTEDKE